MWSDEQGHITYNANQDKDVSGMLKQCNEIGAISAMPDIPGLLVFMKTHVGVYIGNGKVIEAKGHAYGVVETDLKKRPWETYGKLSWISYVEEDNMIDGKIVSMLNDLVDKYGVDKIENAISKLIDTCYDDGNPAKWAEQELKEAKEIGLTDGSNPEMFSTRQEAVIVALRAYKKAKGE